MEKRLYVSDQAIKLKGKEYFRGLTAEALAQHIGHDVDDLLILVDDMDNVYMATNETDEAYIDIDDLFDE